MSARTEPRGVADRLAAVEEQLRRTIAHVSISLSGNLTASIVTARGDLIVGVGPGALARLPVGPNGFVPVADGAADGGISWQQQAGQDATMLAYLLDEA